MGRRIYDIFVLYARVVAGADDAEQLHLGFTNLLNLLLDYHVFRAAYRLGLLVH
jgi:hypothetical protein